MSLRTDLIQLATDYGIPGDLVTSIEADHREVTWHYANLDREDPYPVLRTVTVHLDASPIDFGAGTPIYDALAAERAGAEGVNTHG